MGQCVGTPTFDDLLVYYASDEPGVNSRDDERLWGTSGSILALHANEQGNDVHPALVNDNSWCPLRRKPNGRWEYNKSNCKKTNPDYLCNPAGLTNADNITKSCWQHSGAKIVIAEGCNFHTLKSGRIKCPCSEPPGGWDCSSTCNFNNQNVSRVLKDSPPLLHVAGWMEYAHQVAPTKPVWTHLSLENAGLSDSPTTPPYCLDYDDHFATKTEYWGWMVTALIHRARGLFFFSYGSIFNADDTFRSSAAETSWNALHDTIADFNTYLKNDYFAGKTPSPLKSVNGSILPSFKTTSKGSTDN